MSQNLYKLETDNKISCLQEECSYKFRNPKNKHKSIMEHYSKCHKDIYKLLKYQTKPYSRPLNETKKLEQTNQNNTLKYNSTEIDLFKNNIFDYENESLKEKIKSMNDEDLKQLQKSILLTKQLTKEYYKNNKSFCFHYFVKTDYFIFKFIKESLF